MSRRRKAANGTDEPRVVSNGDRRGYRQVVLFKRLRCPVRKCNSYNLLTYRTWDLGQGRLLRHVRCRTCGKKFLVNVE